MVMQVEIAFQNAGHHPFMNSNSPAATIQKHLVLKQRNSQVLEMEETLASEATAAMKAWYACNALLALAFMQLVDQDI